MDPAQIESLHQVTPPVKSGSGLVCSTCSPEPEENQEVVQQFLTEHADFKPKRERDLLPFAETVDGAM